MTEKNQAKYYLAPTEIESERQQWKDLTAAHTDFDGTAFKLEVNELVWRNAASIITLEQAEKIACDFWQAVMETHN